jgi:tRNA pseudouridine55 synthase
MATGLLVLGLNNATKLLTFLVGESKTYVTTIRLGASTITDDRESEYVELASASALALVDEAAIRSALSRLTGEIMQVPSSVSAIKVNGERAYAKVRGGDEVKLAPRPVTVSRFEMLSTPRLVKVGEHEFVDFDAIIDCSSGTYIRALARDLGAALKVGGHLTALRRTRVGSYDVASATELSSINSQDLPILNSADAARAQFAIRELSAAEVIDLRHGKRLSIGEIQSPERSQIIAGFSPDGSLVAMLEISGKQLKSAVVFVEESE